MDNEVVPTWESICCSRGNPVDLRFQELCRDVVQSLGTVAVSLKQLFHKGFPSSVGVCSFLVGIKARSCGTEHGQWSLSVAWDKRLEERNWWGGESRWGSAWEESWFLAVWMGWNHNTPGCL